MKLPGTRSSKKDHLTRVVGKREDEMRWGGKHKLGPLVPLRPKYAFGSGCEGLQIKWLIN